MNQPAFRPPPGGYDDALRRSRRRRSRRYALVGAVATGALAVVGLALLAGGTEGLSSLRQDQPAGPAKAGPIPGAQATPRTAPSAEARGSASARPSASAVRASLAPDGGEIRPSAAPGVTAAPQQISTPLARTIHPYSNTSPCADNSGRQAAGWCVQYQGAFAGKSAQAVSLTLDLCRLPAFGDANASFPATAEAAFTLTTNEQNPRHVWTHAHQHPGSRRPHHVVVRSGQCLSWTTTWWNRDDSGTPVPPGDYTLAVDVEADNVPDPNAVSTEVYDYRVQ
jgi:hypothetical protein